MLLTIWLIILVYYKRKLFSRLYYKELNFTKRPSFTVHLRTDLKNFFPHIIILIFHFLLNSKNDELAVNCFSCFSSISFVVFFCLRWPCTLSVLNFSTLILLHTHHRLALKSLTLNKKLLWLCFTNLAVVTYHVSRRCLKWKHSD